VNTKEITSVVVKSIDKAIELPRGWLGLESVIVRNKRPVCYCTVVHESEGKAVLDKEKLISWDRLCRLFGPVPLAAAIDRKGEVFVKRLSRSWDEEYHQDSIGLVYVPTEDFVKLKSLD